MNIFVQTILTIHIRLPFSCKHCLHFCELITASKLPMMICTSPEEMASVSPSNMMMLVTEQQLIFWNATIHHKNMRHCIYSSVISILWSPRSTESYLQWCRLTSHHKTDNITNQGDKRHSTFDGTWHLQQAGPLVHQQYSHWLFCLVHYHVSDKDQVSVVYKLSRNQPSCLVSCYNWSRCSILVWYFGIVLIWQQTRRYVNNKTNNAF